jgi:uncharacterized membrane protein YdjX (TVP38/TMEM64 family)
MTHLLDFIRHPGWASIAATMVAYVLLCLAMLPVWPITIALGSIYGIWRGLLISIPASVIGATAVFQLGRSVFRDWARRRVARWERVEAIRRATVGHHGGWIVFLLRVSPVVPFNLLNYALSVTDMRLAAYVITTILGVLPPTLFYLYLGAFSASIARGTEYTGWELTAYVAGLIATALAIWLVGRAVRKTLETELLGEARSLQSDEPIG